MEALFAVVGAVVALWIALILILAVTGRRSAARELAAFLPNMIFLFRGLVADRRVPLRSKLLLGVGMVWLASPIDLVPEFIPVAGPLDDAIVAALVLRYVVRSAGHEVVADHWRGDGATLELILRLVGVPAPRAAAQTRSSQTEGERR